MILIHQGHLPDGWEKTDTNEDTVIYSRGGEYEVLVIQRPTSRTGTEYIVALEATEYAPGYDKRTSLYSQTGLPSRATVATALGYMQGIDYFVQKDLQHRGEIQ